MPNRLEINILAGILGVTITTLRRWDADGSLPAHRDKLGAHRYYFYNEIEDFLVKNYKYLYSVGVKWVLSKEDISTNIPSRFYCPDSSIFKVRLSKLEKVLQDDPKLRESFSLVTSVVGEIGNNSFDHNIGNWPNAPGIFFGYNLETRKIILADRGRGVLATLKKVRDELSNDKDALKVAFTEIVSGRPLEARGNGLKYVRKIVSQYSMKLWFQSGSGSIVVDKDLSIYDEQNDLRGTLGVLEYKNL